MRHRMSVVALLGLVTFLVLRLLLIDFADLRVEIVEQPEPEPFNFADLETQRQEDEDRLLRNRTPAFVDGKWQVEASVDHEVHWERQMQLSEQRLP